MQVSGGKGNMLLTPAKFVFLSCIAFHTAIATASKRAFMLATQRFRSRRAFKIHVFKFFWTWSSQRVYIDFSCQTSIRKARIRSSTPWQSSMPSLKHRRWNPRRVKKRYSWLALTTTHLKLSVLFICFAKYLPKEVRCFFLTAFIDTVDDVVLFFFFNFDC